MQMLLPSLSALAALTFTSASLFGWGSAVRRVAGANGGCWPVTIGLGLSSLIIVGGIVSLAGIAHGIMVVSLMLAGFALFAFHLRACWCCIDWPSVLGRTAPARLETAGATVFILLVTGFAIATQVPPDAYNHFDDLGKYFAHPVRQLETGTLIASPLSALGAETLGGMAFLHSIVLSVVPIRYLNFVDVVFGLFLLMCLGAAAGWRRMLPLPGAFIAPVLIAIVEPQCINASALYTGAALMATAVLFVANEQEPASRAPILLGLVYASLVALKSTFVIFVVLHMLLTAAAIASETLGTGIRWLLRTATVTALGLLPWLALHVPHYIAGMHEVLAAVPPGPSEPLNLFAMRPLFHGATLAAYTSLASLAAIAGILGLLDFRRSAAEAELRRSAGVVVGASTALLAYILLLAVLQPLIASLDTVVRYTIPILLGTVPVVAVLAMGKPPARPSWVGIGMLLAAMSITTAFFVPSCVVRYRQAVEYRSILAYPSQRLPLYRAYMREVFSADAAHKIRKLQHLVPAGQPIVAWISLPHLLDYRRNQILDVDPAGLATRWSQLPRDVGYVMWEYKGPTMPSRKDFEAMTQSTGQYMRCVGQRTLAFANQVENTIRHGELLYDDGETIVARIAEH